MFGLGEKKSNKNTVILLTALGVVALGAAAFALLKNETIRQKLGWWMNDEEALVDTTSEESFPASDAPSWTPTTSLGSLH